MEKRRLKILLIEDDEDDYVLVKDLLAEAPSAQFILDWVSSYQEGLRGICRSEHDAYLLDYRLGERNGIELLQELLSIGCDGPIILLTGKGGYEVDLEAMKSGAADYLVKGQISPDLLERSIRYSIERKSTESELKRYRDRLQDLVKERTLRLEEANEKLRIENIERKRAQEELRESEERYRILVESALDVIYTVRSDRIILSLNPVFTQITGWPVRDWIGRDFTPLIHPDDLPLMLKRFEKALGGELLPPAEMRILSRSGEYRFLEFKTAPQLQRGPVARVIGTARDITERRRAEEKIHQQNTFLNNILESLTHPFYVLDANDYRVVMANSAAAPHGLPPDTRCYALTHRRDMPCGGGDHACPLETIKRTRQPLTVEHIHYDAEGNPRNMEVHGYPIFDEQGSVVQIIEYSFDITERKRMEEALRKAHDELELRVAERTAELEQANEALLGEIAERRKAEDALRLDEFRLEALLRLGQMTDASVEDIADFALEQQVRLTRSRVGALGFLNQEETVLTIHGWLLCDGADTCGIESGSAQIPIDGSSVWASVVSRRRTIINNTLSRSKAANACPESPVLLERCMTIPVFDSGSTVAVALVGNKADNYDQADVRQLSLLMDGMWKLIRRQRAEKALRDAESLAAMGRALSSVAHDMKTPLIAIGGFTSMVQRRLEENDPSREKLDIVIKETRRLENMVKEMLDFSRPLELSRLKEDIRKTVSESIVVVDAVASQRNIKLLVTMGDEVIEAYYDSMRLKQVLINLLMNAVQATPEGGDVSLFCGMEKESLVIDVIDCGCGIPTDKREEIFSPFFTTKKEGTGLGLAIVKKIIDAHGGQIEILDNPEQGVTVRVRIPAK